MSRYRYLPALAIGLTLGLGIVVGTLMTHGVRAAKVGPVRSEARLLSAPSPVELSNSFAQIVEEVGPAVVNINTDSTVRVTGKRFRGPDDAPLDDFFNRLFQFGPFDGPMRDFRQQSLGSGMTLDKSGYVLTNYHVIMRDGEDRQADRMRVYLRDDDGSKGYPAKIIGTDKWTDLAVIKIDAGRPLPTLHLGDSDSMRVGDWVLAIGSPFGLSATVTAGIISAKGRDIEGGREGEFKHFLQTDAAINPGNSGGPLVNLAGQVIGINTAIATSRGAYDGVGFAIPSNTARKVYNSIVSTGAVRRGAIGVSFTKPKNEALLRSFGAEQGVVVDSVEAGSPAEHAGVQRGDVITTVDAKPVSDGEALLAIVSETDPGKKVRINFLRDKRPMSAEVVVGDWNKIVGDVSGGEESRVQAEAEHIGGILGLSVKNFSPEQTRELTEQLHLSGPQGVLVTDVKPGGFAEDVGLQRFDVLLSLNHRPVRSVEDFNRLQSQLKSGEDVLFLIARRNGRAFATYFLADRLP